MPTNQSQLWKTCLDYLGTQLPSGDVNLWIKPLQAVENSNLIRLFAPNTHVYKKVKNNFFIDIENALSELSTTPPKFTLEIGSIPSKSIEVEKSPISTTQPRYEPITPTVKYDNNLIPTFTFDNFVEGRSNQIAKAASFEVSNNPGKLNNPLYLYGGTGLGKTHLMHALGNKLLENNPDFNIVYSSSERFFSEMVKALQHSKIDDFKNYYRNVDALLIDDIQFFAGKGKTQLEFFHTFETLFKKNQQIILTCDRYPKEIDGLEDRLKSRFGWGLTIAIEPPDLETRTAILLNKAKIAEIDLPVEVAYLVAKRLRSHVRELEGALKRLIAFSGFKGVPITEELTKEALRDLFSIQDKLVTVDNIIKLVTDYYKLKESDLKSKKRTRNIARPRQIAMALSKELTNQSLPKIGELFGGRDHTTVIHACKKINELKQEDTKLKDDYTYLLIKLGI